MENSVSEQDSMSQAGWECPACHSVYGVQTKKLRHLRHCHAIRSELEEKAPAVAEHDLINQYNDLLISKETRPCTCASDAYHFCQHIVADIDWNGKMYIVTVLVKNRSLKHVRYASIRCLIYLMRDHARS